MSKTTILLTVAMPLSLSFAFCAETNVVRNTVQPSVAKSVTKEGREARKNAAIQPFDLNNDGKLDGAERALLKNDLKAKMDPIRKRVYVPKAEPPAPAAPKR